MMNKEPAEYIREFHERIKDEYPNLSHSQVDNICRTNFRMIKTEMKKGSLRSIRLRYFGLFIVYKGRALGLLNQTKKMFKEEKIDMKTLKRIRTIVKIYLKREYNESLPH